MLRVRGRGQQLGRLVDPHGRQGRPGPRHPSDMGRGLLDQQRPHRDLLPRRDPRARLPAGARHPAVRRDLLAVGLQRREDHALLQPVGARWRRVDGEERRGVRQHAHAGRLRRRVDPRRRPGSRSSARRTWASGSDGPCPEATDRRCVHQQRHRCRRPDASVPQPRPELRAGDRSLRHARAPHRHPPDHRGHRLRRHDDPVLPRRRLLRRRHRHRPRAARGVPPGRPGRRQRRVSPA